MSAKRAVNTKHIADLRGWFPALSGRFPAHGKRQACGVRHRQTDRHTYSAFNFAILSTQRCGERGSASTRYTGQIPRPKHEKEGHFFFQIWLLKRQIANLGRKSLPVLALRSVILGQCST